jgi:Tfp pilus assembly protein PilO
MKISATQLMIVAGVVALLVAAAAVFLLVVPQFSRLSDLEAQRVSAQQTMSQTQARLAQLEQIKRSASETQAQLIKISNQVPDSPELPTLVLELQNAADSAGLDFQSIKPTEPTTPKPAPAPAPQAATGYDEISIQMRLQGRWADILDFLRRAQTMTRGVRMVSVELVPAPPPVGSATTTPTPDTPIDLTTNLTMKVYVMSQAPAATTAPVQPAPVTPAAP